MRLNAPHLGLAILRIVVGIIFVMHGGQKLFVFGIGRVQGMFGGMHIPMAAVAAVVVSLVEFAGGLALVFGFFSRWAAILLAINMAGAIYFVHLHGGFFLPRGFEFALAMLAANLCIALAGPGSPALNRR